MQYIYKMSKKMHWETKRDAAEENMSIEKYVTKHFGLRGECVKVEVF